LSNWTSKAFTAAELSNPEISGPSADPDKDGYPNVVEYALGLNPKAAEQNVLRPELVSVNGSPILQVSFTRPKGAVDLDYIAETLDRIGTAGCTDCAPFTVKDNGDGTETVQVRLVPSPGAHEAYLLLRVALK
jgi:hypothetical protein